MAATQPLKGLFKVFLFLFLFVSSFASIGFIRHIKFHSYSETLYETFEDYTRNQWSRLREASLNFSLAPFNLDTSRFLSGSYTYTLQSVLFGKNWETFCGEEPERAYNESFESIQDMLEGDSNPLIDIIFSSDNDYTEAIQELQKILMKKYFATVAAFGAWGFSIFFLFWLCCISEFCICCCKKKSQKSRTHLVGCGITLFFVVIGVVIGSVGLIFGFKIGNGLGNLQCDFYVMATDLMLGASFTDPLDESETPKTIKWMGIAQTLDVLNEGVLEVLDNLDVTLSGKFSPDLTLNSDLNELLTYIDTSSATYDNAQFTDPIDNSLKLSSSYTNVYFS